MSDLRAALAEARTAKPSGSDDMDAGWNAALNFIERAAARESAGAGLDELRAALDSAMAFGHTLATSPGPSLGHSGERYTDCPQTLCHRVAALITAERAATQETPAGLVRERIVDITGVDAIEAAVLRSLLDEVETLCDDNGQNAIRTDDLAALIDARITGRLPAAPRDRRPTAAELMAMPDEEFAAHVTRAGLVPPSDEEPPS